MNPFIVTVTKPCGAQFGRCNDPDHADASRRAVVTLEEAKSLARDSVEALHIGPLTVGSYEEVAADALAISYHDVHTAIDGLTTNGGTVGPLPDGTVIEVEQVTALDLFRVTKRGPEHRENVTVDEQACAAFNEAQAV